MSGMSLTTRFIIDSVYRSESLSAVAADGSVRGGKTGLDGHVVAAVFGAVVPMKFSPTTDIREMASFLIGCRVRYREEASNVPVREGQAIMRALLGEPKLLNYIDKSVAATATLWISIWLLRDMNEPWGAVSALLEGIAQEGE
jgi:hypothetical protein